ncbi:MAG TPA: M48 family metallopeptidase [Fimbriimonadaceae bacterium]|nr:M48 family metallopeptidase [Fimbriimonadaceae bacterium]
MKRRKFDGISSDAFVADNDRRALEALKAVPLLPTLIKKFYEVGLDRWLYCWNMAMSVRCGPKQYRTLHEILRESCAVLDMPEPELYVTSNPFPNAWTSGVERPYITIRSSMIDTLSDEQLYHLMGHELGHIKAGHTLYKSVASVLAPLLELIGRRTLGLGDAASIALVLAMAEWSRQAEITADRAGLLVSQSLDTSIDANLALCAGPNRLSHEMSREAFMDQARAYQAMNALDALGKVVVFLLLSSTFTHPMPVHRTHELDRWVLSGAYDRILAGEYPRVEEPAGAAR